MGLRPVPSHDHTVKERHCRKNVLLKLVTWLKNMELVDFDVSEFEYDYEQNLILSFFPCRVNWQSCSYSRHNVECCSEVGYHKPSLVDIRPKHQNHWNPEISAKLKREEMRRIEALSRGKPPKAS